MVTVGGRSSAARSTRDRARADASRLGIGSYSESSEVHSGGAVWYIPHSGADVGNGSARKHRRFPSDGSRRDRILKGHRGLARRCVTRVVWGGRDSDSRASFFGYLLVGQPGPAQSSSDVSPLCRNFGGHAKGGETARPRSCLEPRNRIHETADVGILLGRDFSRRWTDVARRMGLR